MTRKILLIMSVVCGFPIECDLWFMVYESLPYIHVIIGCMRCAEEKKWIDKKCKLVETKDKKDWWSGR